MRMDQSQGRSADDIVNHAEEREISWILHTFGDERFARRIAAVLVANRPIATTAQLAELVRNAIPAPARRTAGHPAKRPFQPIRIPVNEEPDTLPAPIARAIAVLPPHAPCAGLSYPPGARP